LFDIVHTPMPRSTDRKIQALCREVVEANTDAEVHQVLTQLRLALEEHFRLAKESLGLSALGSDE
jgi:hypothetical protein